MRKWVFMIIILLVVVIPVSAMEFTAPTVPESAEKYMPREQENFAQGLLYILRTAAGQLIPELKTESLTCLSVITLVLLASVVQTLSKNSTVYVRIAAAVAIGTLLLEPIHSMILLGSQTIMELSDYGKLLLPVMTAAMAAQGGTTSSAAIYTGTVFFNGLLTTLISRLVLPALYIYLCLCIAESALNIELLKKVRDFMKWAMVSSMKWILYIFTGYISITGIVSGTVDSSALKATKIAISGAVPVVGGILSDASETILLSAGIMKNTAGVYGILAVLAVCVSPFLLIGAQYLLLKLAGTVCGIFGYKPAADLVQNFTSGMGVVLAMTGTVCVLLLVSLVCFLRGMGR